MAGEKAVPRQLSPAVGCGVTVSGYPHTRSDLTFGLSEDGAACVPNIARSADGRVGRPPCGVNLMRPKEPLQTDGQVHAYYDLYVPSCFRHHQTIFIQEWQVGNTWPKTKNPASNDSTINTEHISSSTFATASSTRVTNSVTGLKPDILAILDKLVDNKPDFTSAGVVSIVQAKLQSLQNLTNALSTEIQAKVTTADKATIVLVIVEVDADYSGTTAVFY